MGIKIRIKKSGRAGVFPDTQARAFVRMGLAELFVEPKPQAYSQRAMAPEQESKDQQEARQKRKYTRRDMKAED